MGSWATKPEAVHRRAKPIAVGSTVAVQSLQRRQCGESGRLGAQDSRPKPEPAETGGVQGANIALAQAALWTYDQQAAGCRKAQLAG